MGRHLTRQSLTRERRRRVCVVLVDRANYGRLKPVMSAVQARPGLELLVLAAGTMVLERFDQPVRIVRNDGFPVDGEVYIELEGSTPATMAKSIGMAIIEFASELQRLKPDVLVLIGDRYEALAAAITAAYMNVTIVHLQGGEVSGSIDESARHAITKLAHFHFPSTQRSRDYLRRMGERRGTILGVGCPSSDLAQGIDLDFDSSLFQTRGGGAGINPAKPYRLVIFHPTTTQFGDEATQVRALLSALAERPMQSVMLWPNIDAGADHISKSIRIFRSHEGAAWLKTMTNLAPEDYLRVLGRAACAVGNSSSFVRDASYFGTPVVLIGNRQDYRETAEHVYRVPAESEAIAEGLRRQLDHGPYPPSDLYGDGHVSQRIAAALEALVPYRQKQISFVGEDEEAEG